MIVIAYRWCRAEIAWVEQCHELKGCDTCAEFVPLKLTLDNFEFDLDHSIRNSDFGENGEKNLFYVNYGLDSQF